MDHLQATSVSDRSFAFRPEKLKLYAGSLIRNVALSASFVFVAAVVLGLVP